MWKPVAEAPFDQNLQLAVINRDGTHPLVFACRRTPLGWVRTGTDSEIDVHPTHWRPWPGEFRDEC
jgi:hypothetical protein